MTFDDVRDIAGRLPETVETTSWGTPSFKAGKKLLCRLREEGDVLVVVSEAGVKEALISSRPEVYFEMPHYEGTTYVLVRLPMVERDELADLFDDAWQLVATPAMRRRRADDPPATS